jgi:hypothetical protein
MKLLSYILSQFFHHWCIESFYNLISVSCYITEAVYLIFVPYSLSYTLSVYPPPSLYYQPPRLEWKW